MRWRAYRSAEAGHAQERSGEVQRGGKGAAPQDGNAPARLDEVERIVERDAVRDAEAAVEVQQVDATAQQDVLAIVDELAVFGPGRSAAAEERPRFEQIHTKAGLSQGGGGGEAGQTAAGDNDARHRSYDRRNRSLTVAALCPGPAQSRDRKGAVVDKRQSRAAAWQSR